jgi:tRNA(fMet)-specific endonuclease VapC
LAYMLDTNVAIRLRDRDLPIIDKVERLEAAVLISVITRIELEGGVYKDPRLSAVRRPLLDAILEAVPTVPFDDTAADSYRLIVATAGFSRRKILDRMIAAQALVHHATLVTFNPQDFNDVPALQLLAW